MSVCTFFGHKDCPGDIAPKLREKLICLIDHGVDLFYVGHQGQFDALVRATLWKLSVIYPHIHYAVVLAYLPSKRHEGEDYSDAMLPEGIENIHPRHAIVWRNDWMLKQSDYVVTYLTHTWGGTAKYVEKAKKQGKVIHNLI